MHEIQYKCITYNIFKDLGSQNCLKLMQAVTLSYTHIPVFM